MSLALTDIPRKKPIGAIFQDATTAQVSVIVLFSYGEYYDFKGDWM